MLKLNCESLKFTNISKKYSMQCPFTLSWPPPPPPHKQIHKSFSWFVNQYTSKTETKNKRTQWTWHKKCKLTDARGDKTFSGAGFESLWVAVSRLGHRYHTHFICGSWFQVIQGQPEVIGGTVTISVPFMFTCRGKQWSNKLLASC